MGTRSKLSERLRVISAITPQDIDTADVTSAYVKLDHHRRVMAVVNTASLAQGKKLTVQLKQATAAVGTGAKNLGAAVEVVAGSGGGAVSAIAEAMAEELDTANGYAYVAVTVGTDAGSATDGAAFLILGDGRFSE